SGMTGDTGGLSCRPRTSTDCDAGEFLDGGNCRAPVGGDCSAPNMIPMIANRMLSCVACGSGLLEATAAELVCRPPQNNAECNALVTGEFLDNTNTCRAPVGGDCPAQNMIPSVSTGGVLSCVACGGDMIEATAAELTCRLPEDNGECGALTTGEIFDISEPDNCRPLVATDCDAGEFLDNTGDCRTPIDSDCPVQNQIAAVAAGVLTCRLPINNADCQAAYGDRVFDMTEATRCRTANRAELCTANPGNNDQFASQVFTPVPGGTVIRGMQGRTNSITLGDNSLAELFNRVNADGGGNENNRASRFRLRQGDGWLAAGGSQGGDQGQPGVGDIVRQPYFGPFQSRQFLQAGDVIAVLDDNTGNSNIAGNIVEIFQIYVGNGTLRLARGAAIPARIAGSTVTENAPTGCTVTGTQFFLDDDWNPQTALGDTVRMLDEFGSFRDTREILLGGVLNKHNSVQANNFSFAADESLKNLHIEYAMPETKTGDISWRNYSGYRMQNGGKTQIYYQKAAAEYAPAGK
ncbi:MAG: hypothetical protein HAW59_07180, partial [Betaproteobacteria bacterium]|nr:hypothetical protein [Betaproteobacteria bacterium]